MFKKWLILPLIALLAACSNGYANYGNQAQLDSQRTFQTQYNSYAQCYSAFPFAGDCYVGTNGIWYSPPYYAWGAVIHHNHVVSYGHVVPTGGAWVRTSYTPSVDYSRARSYVTTRTAYYQTQSRASYSSTQPSNSKVSKINFGSSSSNTSPSYTPPTKTASSTVTRSTYTPSSSSPSRTPSRINFSSSSSSSSSRSSGFSSSSRSSSSSSSSRSSSSGRGR